MGYLQTELENDLLLLQLMYHYNLLEYCISHFHFWADPGSRTDREQHMNKIPVICIRRPEVTGLFIKLLLYMNVQ